MNFSFAEALAALDPNAAVRIANQTRPPANYLFNAFLPERNMPTYQVDAANMVVRSTMAGLVAMDSPYPPGGIVEVSSFLENTAKLGIHNALTEQSLRTLQALMNELGRTGALTVEFLQREALNFLAKVIIQAQLDAAEWMRGKALVTGRLDWAFNEKTLAIDYGYDPTHFLTTRTDANNDAYGDTGSLFWADMVEARRLLRNNIRAVVMNSTTMDEILNNDVNMLQVLTQENTRFRVRRYKNVGGQILPDPDSRYTMEFIVYDEEAEVLDLANPGRTQTIKFMPDGKILFVGNNANSGYRPGQGSTDDPNLDLALGYHHIAPTVESGGSSGRWARLYTPEGYPMQLRAEAASNELPVITAPDKVVIATTEIMP